VATRRPSSGARSPNVVSLSRLTRRAPCPQARKPNVRQSFPADPSTPVSGQKPNVLRSVFFFGLRRYAWVATIWHEIPLQSAFDLGITERPASCPRSLRSCWRWLTHRGLLPLAGRGNSPSARHCLATRRRSREGSFRPGTIFFVRLWESVRDPDHLWCCVHDPAWA